MNRITVEKAVGTRFAHFSDGAGVCSILTEETVMPQGDKSKYTDKQKRQAEHIEEGYKEKGVSAKTAAARAWATVNSRDGGGKKAGGSGRKTSASGKRSK
jgi:hypothetical protein